MGSEAGRTWVPRPSEILGDAMGKTMPAWVGFGVRGQGRAEVGAAYSDFGATSQEAAVVGAAKRESKGVTRSGADGQVM